MPNLERRIYAMDLNIPGPYEAYVNEILVEKNNETGLHNTLINCNQAVLKSGKYNFKIKVFPEPEEQEKGGIQPETLQFLKVGLSRYEKIREGEDLAFLFSYFGRCFLWRGGAMEATENVVTEPLSRALAVAAFLHNVIMDLFLSHNATLCN